MQATEEHQMTGGAGFLTISEQASRHMAYVEAMEFHSVRVRALIVATLAGHIPFCPGILNGAMQRKMTASDLYAAITEDIDEADLAMMLASSLDWEAKATAAIKADELITAYADKTADLLAKEEAGL